MRALVIVFLAVVLALAMGGQAAAQTGTVRPEATPQWDVGVHRTDTGGMHCQYFEAGTAVPQTRLRAQYEEQALGFREQSGKWEIIERERAFEREPVVREEALRERDITLFGGPTEEAEIAEKWTFRQEPTRLPEKYAMPTTWEEGMGRGAMMEPAQRPPTHIAEAQQRVTDLSRFERIDGCLYVRPDAPSPLQQVNNRQFSPQWHF